MHNFLRLVSVWILSDNDLSFSQLVTYNNEKHEGWCTEASKMKRDLRFLTLLRFKPSSVGKESKGKDESKS